MPYLETLIASKSEYYIDRTTLVELHVDPQIVECQTCDGIILYIRWTGEELVCLEKRLGKYICSGSPFLFKGAIKIPLDQIEFHLEMYSRHQIKFY